MPALCSRTQPLAAAVCAGLMLLPLGDRARAQAAAPPVSSAPVPKTSFDEVTARLDKGGSFYLYLSTEQWLAGLSEWENQVKEMLLQGENIREPADREKIARGFALFEKVIQQSGLAQITGVGGSTITLGPGVYRNTLFVHHYRGKETGLLATAFGSAPHPLTALDLLPADTAFASNGDLDIPLLFDTVRATLLHSGIPEVEKAFKDGLQQLSRSAGMPVEALVDSLGKEVGLVVTLDPSKPLTLPSLPYGQTIPRPNVALLLQTKDDTIFRHFDEMFGRVPIFTKVDEPGLQMRKVTLSDQMTMGFHPTIAQWGTLLVIASDDQMIRAMIAAEESGTGWKQSPEFARLAAGMPTEGNGFAVATERFVSVVKQFQTDMIANQPGVPPEQAAMMRRMFDAQKLGANYSVSAHVENGWLSVSQGAQKMNQVMVPLVLLPAAGVLAGVAMPVFNSVQEKGKATKSLAQAKQIGLACRLYAEDHDGKYPATLDALVPTYMTGQKSFISPFAPDEPVGYTLTPNVKEGAPDKTILVEDRFAERVHQRVVVHLDGSGEVTKLPKP